MSLTCAWRSSTASSACDDFVPWLARLSKLAAGDPRLVDCQRRGEHRLAQLAVQDSEARAKLLAMRPDFDEIERLFATALPRHLRRVWEAWYEGEHPHLRLIRVDRDRLNDLVSKPISS